VDLSHLYGKHCLLLIKNYGGKNGHAALCEDKGWKQVYCLSDIGRDVRND